jgi:malate dehydrogenase (oxaloacetate-decarboxylating)(NADP+)
VAFLSFSTFGDPRGSVIPETVRKAVGLLDARGDVGFEYEGEMAADVALDRQLQALYPFCRLTGTANVLVMPGLHAAHILSKAIPRLTSAPSIGPLLMGLSKPAQILSIASGVNGILDMACLAAHDSLVR